MEKDATGQERGTAPDIEAALDDLMAALIETPHAYEVFVQLPALEQVGLVEWVQAASNRRNRRRRVNMICGVLARTSGETIELPHKT